MIIISWLSNWAGAIIVAVVIGTIIEMILPEGNCKKYIKVVIGIYVLFTIVSPVITKFTGRDIQVSDSLIYTNEDDEQFTISLDNGRVVKEPGFDILIHNVDELSFYQNDRNIYREVKYCKNGGVKNANA